MPLYGAWVKNNEDRALSAYEQERHERWHSSLEVKMSGLVINPEYSWLGASPDGVVHDPGCTDLMDYLKSSALIITVTATLFKKHPRRGFVGWNRLEKGKLILREHHIITKCKDRWLSALENGATMWLIQMLGFLSSRFIFYFKNSGLLWLQSLFVFNTTIVPKLANIL